MLSLHLQDYSLLLNPLPEAFSRLPQLTRSWSNPPLILSPPTPSRKTYSRRPVVSARNSRRESGSGRPWKNLPKLLAFLASNLKMLPEPWDVVIQELSGGEIWSLGLRKGVKGWSFCRRRMRSKRKFGALWVWLGFGLCGSLLLLFGRDLNNELILGLLGFSLLITGASSKRTRRVFRDWILGFVLFGALLGFRFGKGGIQKWRGRATGCFPVLQLVKGKGKTW